jgi:signal recognition particle subunit SRP19
MIIWTASVDRGKTRRQGRKIPRSLSIDSPRLSELEAAARSLSLDPTPKTGASRPSSWWERSGYLLVERRNSSRAEILKSLAKQIAKERGSKKT